MHQNLPVSSSRSYGHIGPDEGIELEPSQMTPFRDENSKLSDVSPDVHMQIMENQSQHFHPNEKGSFSNNISNLNSGRAITIPVSALMSDTRNGNDFNEMRLINDTNDVPQHQLSF